MKILTLLMMAFFIFSDQLIAHPKSIKKSPVLNETTSERAEISLERIDRFGQMCEQNISNGNIPGFVTPAARNGRIVH